MTDKLRAFKIERLISAKYPGSHAPLPIATLNSRTPGPTAEARAAHAQRLSDVDAYRVELSRLTGEEIDAKHQKIWNLEAELAKLRKDQEEARRPFNLPTAAADFEYWSKVEFWTLDESVALLLGKSPEVVSWKTVQAFVSVSAFAKQYERLRNIALRAQAMNRGQSAVFPSAVIAWAENFDIPVPDALRGELAKRTARSVAATTISPLPVLSANRPIDYVHTITIAHDARIFPLHAVPAATALAAFPTSMGGIAYDDSHWPMLDTIKGVHAIRLEAAVRAGVVVPYVDGFLEPAPGAWDMAKDSGLVLPLGELRKFTDSIMMELRVADAPVTQVVPTTSQDPPVNQPLATTTPAWTPTRPERDDGLAWPLYRVLKVAFDRGLPRPRAREVLEAFRESKPPEIVEAMADEVKYFDLSGNLATADLESIRKRIERMTARQSDS